MQFTAEDKRVFVEIIEETSHDRSKAQALFKVFYNIAMKFNSLSAEMAEEVSKLMQLEKNSEALAVLSKSLQEVGVTILSIAEEDETAQSFSTGQLAKIFGVSISTINNWIDAKRFVGFSREKRNKQARIKGSTVWISPTGEHMTVGEVHKLYEENQKRLAMKKEDEGRVAHIRYLVDTINFFEKRYNGPFDKVVSEKGDPKMSDDFMWSREGTEWRSLLREINTL